jgi:hypothetical protein
MEQNEAFYRALIEVFWLSNVPFTGLANGDEANCRKYRQSNLVIFMEKGRIL